MTRIITRADDGRVDRVFTAVYCFFPDDISKTDAATITKLKQFSEHHVFPASRPRVRLPLDAGFPGRE